MTNAYESGDPARYKRVGLPLSSGTAFVISQGAFGRASHSEKGNEYQWDFDVPYGTRVVAVEAGVVIDVWEPDGGGGCDAKYSNDAHNVKVRHADGTVAQYVHVDSRVRVGETVQRGQTIAATAENGWICQPQLHFGIYRSERTLYSSPQRESIPVRFDGLPSGLAKERLRATVP
jgi:murein DD-endopeptidase MepM/ murein hydrolase activator NlpD